MLDGLRNSGPATGAAPKGRWRRSAEEVHVGVSSRFNGHDEEYLECPVGALLEDDAVRGLVAVAEVDLPAVGQVASGGHGRQRLTVSPSGGDVGQDASGFGGQVRVVLLQALQIGNGGGQVLDLRPARPTIQRLVGLRERRSGAGAASGAQPMVATTSSWEIRSPVSSVSRSCTPTRAPGEGRGAVCVADLSGTDLARPGALGASPQVPQPAPTCGLACGRNRVREPVEVVPVVVEVEVVVRRSRPAGW